MYKRQLYRLARGDDDGFVEQAFLRPLLWGRRVSILLDFAPPKFQRATFFEQVVDAIDALERMGVHILVYTPSRVETPQEKYALVTEQEVLLAHGRGDAQMICERDAIITPLAWEKAAELGVALE